MDKKEAGIDQSGILLQAVLLTYKEAEFMSKLSTVREFYEFIIVRKKYWLAPVIILLLLLSLLIFFSQNSIIAPFIYTLF